MAETQLGKQQNEYLEPVEGSFFDLSAKDIDGNDYSFQDLKDKRVKAVVVMNSASE